MRIIVVWIYAFAMLFMVSVGWWVTLPVVIGISYALNDMVGGGAGRSVMTGVQYVAYAWGPLLCCFILLWAFISSQKRDIESEVYH